eukprot:scaffold210742_cov26-Tisochrysis_lutea.AAC.2
MCAQPSTCVMLHALQLSRVSKEVRRFRRRRRQTVHVGVQGQTVCGQSSRSRLQDNEATQPDVNAAKPRRAIIARSSPPA